ncbi:Phosphatidate cytidylyltransferase 2 [Xenotaenia resolanae]|uniref:phosphatidate cytidylyltransferase n=1 Tax=Xenotaenia resolanae TaxID=208358 RepID=A0ABV0X890_9TELE
MISGFFLIIYMGPITLIFVVMCVQIKCFHEIITIGYRVYHSYELPWFRTLSWYFLICVNYFFYGETVADSFGALVRREEPLQFLARYHRFISFTLYLAGESVLKDHMIQCLGETKQAVWPLCVHSLVFLLQTGQSDFNDKPCWFSRAEH